MSVPEILRAKRLGQTLDGAAIHEIVRGVADGSVSEGQIGAFTMAVCLNGMTAAECADLTLAMADSGVRIRWDEENLPGPCVDKHSTGGVGDKKFTKWSQWKRYVFKNTYWDIYYFGWRIVS